MASCVQEHLAHIPAWFNRLPVALSLWRLNEAHANRELDRKLSWIWVILNVISVSHLRGNARLLAQFRCSYMLLICLFSMRCTNAICISSPRHTTTATSSSSFFFSLTCRWKLLDLRKTGGRKTNGDWRCEILMLNMSRPLVSLLPHPPVSFFPSPMSSLPSMSLYGGVIVPMPRLLPPRRPSPGLSMPVRREISHQGTSNSYNCFLRAKYRSFIGKSVPGTIRAVLTLLLLSPALRRLYAVESNSRPSTETECFLSS